VAEIVIVGAGLTGLAAAYYLEQQGFFDYIIVEQHDQAGGLLRSEYEQGFTFDYTGHWIHCNNQLFSDFLRDVIGFEQLTSFQRQAGIFSHNIITAYPFQINLYGLPIDVATECIEAYVTRPYRKSQKPTSFYAWVLKHFGSGLGRHFFFPYNSKLLAYDVKKVHHSWTGRFIPSTTLREIIQGTISPTPLNNVGYNSIFHYPKSGGIQTLIQCLLGKISQSVSVNKSVAYLDLVGKKIFFSDGTHHHYNQLITTMPLNNLLHCTNHAPLQALAPRLHCNTVINYNLGCNIPLIEKFHWLYFPESQFSWYRLGFWHNVCPQLAPSKHTSLYAEYSYQPLAITSTTQAKNIDKMHQQLMSFFNLCPNNITTQKTLMLKHAYVIYDSWREKHIDNILAQLAEHHVYSIGRYGAWKYASMQEAVIDGYNVVQTIRRIWETSPKNIRPATCIKQQALRKKQIDVTTN
jgi:protoporphyrinogen oxidase